MCLYSKSTTIFVQSLIISTVYVLIHTLWKINENNNNRKINSQYIKYNICIIFCVFSTTSECAWDLLCVCVCVCENCVELNKEWYMVWWCVQTKESLVTKQIFDNMKSYISNTIYCTVTGLSLQYQKKISDSLCCTQSKYYIVF